MWITSQEKMLGVFTKECDKCTVKGDKKLPKPETSAINTQHSSEPADVFDYTKLEYITFNGEVHEDNWSTYLPSYT